MLTEHPRTAAALTSGVLGFITYIEKFKNFSFRNLLWKVGTSVFSGLYRHQFYREILPHLKQRMLKEKTVIDQATHFFEENAPEFLAKKDTHLQPVTKLAISLQVCHNAVAAGYNLEHSYHLGPRVNQMANANVVPNN
jgi:hypothetical protein